MAKRISRTVQFAVNGMRISQSVQC